MQPPATYLWVYNIRFTLESKANNTRTTCAYTVISFGLVKKSVYSYACMSLVLYYYLGVLLFQKKRLGIGRYICSARVGSEI